MRSLLCGILLISGLSAAEAKGRFKTVEEAQEYLQRALPGSRYTDADVAEVMVNMKESYRQANNPEWDYTVNIRGEGLIVDASALGECRSRILQDYTEIKTELIVREHWSAPVKYHRVQPLYEYQHARALFAASAGGYKEYGAPAGFNWGELDDVRVLGDSVEITHGFPLKSSMVRMGDRELASAAGEAMQFLHATCRKKKSGAR